MSTQTHTETHHIGNLSWKLIAIDFLTILSWEANRRDVTPFLFSVVNSSVCAQDYEYHREIKCQGPDKMADKISNFCLGWGSDLQRQVDE
uniref:Uncharacterized protein n=1 Tax=Physcomitrium patens TaxID=3218 RepID=A0A2K1K8J9_PHYPA|nr:hypothetical protein PHYPA_012002 [Physcomitrium patens]